MPSDPASVTSAQEQLSNGISKRCETFFSEAVDEKSPSDWDINYDVYGATAFPEYGIKALGARQC